MQGDLELTGYSVNMVLRAQGEAGRISGDARQMMSNPLPVDTEGEQTVFASARDQLILVIEPPNASLTDISGEWPTRSKFTEGLSELIDQLLGQSVSIPAYAWNIEGTLRNLDRSQVMGCLFDQPRIDRILGGDTEPQWSVPQIEFVSDSTFSNVLILNLRQDAHPVGNLDALHFTMTSHFEREIVGGDAFEGQGQEFTRNAEGILARLVD